MKFEVKIPKKGTLAGSCGYVKAILENFELCIANTKTGAIAVFATNPNGDKVLICRTQNDPEDANWRDDTGMHGYETKGKWLLHIHPTYDGEYTHGLFPVLTDAAQNYVSQFIEKCSEKLAEYLENDM